MRAPALFAAVLLGVGCRGEAAPAASAPASPAPAPVALTAAPHLIAEYNILYDHASGEIVAEARTSRALGASFGVDGGAEDFVRSPEAAGESGAFTAMRREGRAFFSPVCTLGPCRIRYRIALRDAARRLDDLDVATREGEAIEAPPFTWILAPNEPPAGARLRFRVKTTQGSSFATGVFRAPDGDGWEIAAEDLYTGPYSVFGPLRTRRVEIAGAAIDVAITPGKLVLDDDQIAKWVGDAARAVYGYLGRYPMPSALVVLVPSDGRWVGGGRTLSGGGGTVYMRIGERAPRRAYEEDWVIVHEMTHLVLPSLPREHNWAEEGLSTYAEPFERVRAGQLTEEAAWKGLVEGLPNGLPGPRDRGLDHTPTWGRVYWGGALYWLLADVEIRKRTNNEKGLEHALRGILDAGLNNAVRRPIKDVLAIGDKATGTTALTDLYGEMGSSPHPVDLAALTAQLGVSVSHGKVTFDDKAPLAAVRKAITTGKAP